MDFDAHARLQQSVWSDVPAQCVTGVTLPSGSATSLNRPMWPLVSSALSACSPRRDRSSEGLQHWVPLLRDGGFAPR